MNEYHKEVLIGVGIAAVFTGLIIWLAVFIDKGPEHHKRLELVAKQERAARIDWLNTHKCVRTSYVATVGNIIPVYTCPDGTAYVPGDVPL